MSELRLNVVTKEWVVIAPERAARPADHRRTLSRPPLPAFEPSCPFCPGNEHQTAAETHRTVHHDGGWRTRVVINRYPALAPSAEEPRTRHRGLQHNVPGIGAHEVIIETPRHDLSLALLPPDHVETILRTYRHRYRAFNADPRVAYIVVFKNHGAAAGTSLHHPHSQIVALPVVSYQVRDRVRTLQDHFALYGECVLCRMLEEEILEQSRLLFVSPSFVAFIPYAALSRFHIWIFPRRHVASFGDVSDEELGELTVTLRSVLRRLYFGLSDPDFNYVIRSTPRGGTGEDFHWYISIIPRTGSAAGFELGSGVYINDAYPETSADYLRSVEVPEE